MFHVKHLQRFQGTTRNCVYSLKLGYSGPARKKLGRRIARPICGNSANERMTAEDAYRTAWPVVISPEGGPLSLPK